MNLGRRLPARVGGLVALTHVACGGAESDLASMGNDPTVSGVPVATVPGVDSNVEGNLASGSGGVEPNTGSEIQQPRCAAPDGVSSSPRSVVEAVALINALPMPVALPCFLEALARPLQLSAANSPFSAQPAVGARSPRIFLFLEPLTLSVVPDGPGQQLLEFGELRGEARSLKAEVEFPVQEQLLLEVPFERVLYNDSLTDCAFCHQAEEPADDMAFGFVSQALRPQPIQRVALERVHSEFETCDAALEPQRCAILGALFSRGEVVERDFPSDLATFF